MRHTLAAWRLAGLVFIVLSLGFAGGVVADRLVATPLGYNAAEPASVRGSFATFWEVWNLASKRYVDPKAVRPPEMIEGAINGMLATLGDSGHTRYLTPRGAKAEESTLRGRYEGIGIELRPQAGTATISGTFEGSPAQRAGLRHGDVIARVDGLTTAGMTLNELSNRIRGTAGTTVRLTIRRPGLGDEFEVTVARAVIKNPPVTWFLIPGTGIAQVRIASFSENSGQDLRQALEQAHRAGATAIVMDLRENFGGLVDQTLRAASEFLEPNVTVYIERNRKGERKAQHPLEPAQGRGTALADKLVVLIDGGTASAAEILAGALQDNHRARLVGETTLGTGTVLNTYHLANGGSLLLGTQEWLTPTGTPIKGRGIRPDKLVTLAPTVAPLFPNEARGLSVEEYAKRVDQQLQAAVDSLRGSGS
jgi:carboxyl-terminal processing protease